MTITEHLPTIENEPSGVFVIHEKFERYIELHAHSKGQLSYIDNGVAYITVENQTFVVPSHYFFWIPIGIPHILRVSEKATSIQSIYFGINEHVNFPFVNRLGIYPADELIIQMIKFSEKWSEQMILPGDEGYIFLQSMLQVIHPLTAKTVPIILPITENEHLKKVLAYLANNIGENLTLKGVSAKFNTSERTLSRYFQTELKLSFLQYIKHLRIIKAIELLQKTNLSLAEIGNKVGYETLGAFSNTFTEITRIRPSEMRKNFYK